MKLALLLLSLLGATTELPRVMPGSVATVAVQLPSTGPAVYEIRPSDEIRLVSPATGELAEGVGIIPVTFNVGRSRASGPFTVGEIALDPGTDRERLVPIEVYVIEQREVKLEVLAERPNISIGDEISVRLLVRNLGNAVDSVALGFDAEAGFSIDELPRTVVVEAGASAIEIVRIRASNRLISGPVRRIVFHATAGDLAVLEEVRLTVTDAPDLDRAYLPGTFFVGTGNVGAIGETSLPSFSANIAGDLFPGTRLTLTTRHSADLVTPAALQPYLSGSPFRATLARGGWTLTGGDVALIGSVLTGHASPGNGIQLRGGVDQNFVSLTYAESMLLGGGRTIGARVQRETGIGTLGVRVGTEPGIFGGTQNDHATLTYSLGSGARHQLEAEGGYITRGQAEAFGAETTYRFRGESHSMYARARAINTGDAVATIPTNELQAGSDIDLFAGFRAQVGASINGSYLGSGARRNGEAAGSAGLSWYGKGIQLASGMSVGRFKSLSGVGQSRTMTASASIPLGRWATDLSIQRATRELGQFTSGTFGLRRSAERGWLQASTSYALAPYGPAILRGDVSGELDLNVVSLRAGAGTSAFAGALQSTSGWGSVSVPVIRRTELVLGSEYRPWAVGTSPWVFSIGIQRRAAIPLPKRDVPSTRGLAFEDRNANGVQDADEPGVPELLLRAGSSLVSTLASGEFEMPANGERIDLDAQGRWFILNPNVRASSGTVLIPLVTPAALRVRVFTDLNGNGSRDETEGVIAEVPIQLRDSDGRLRTEESTAQGEALFTDLRPGGYTVVLFDRPDAEGNRVERSFEVDVVSGQTSELVAAGESPRREIRMSRLPSASPSAP